MAYRTIGQDCAAQITLGSLANGQAINFGAATPIKAYLKKIEVDEDGKDEEVSSLGDGQVKKRYKRSQARVRFTIQVPDGGCVVGVGKYGYAMKVEVKPNSSLGAYETYVGAVEHRSLNIDDGENQEVVEVGCGIEGYTYTGVFS